LAPGADRYNRIANTRNNAAVAASNAIPRTQSPRHRPPTTGGTVSTVPR
jgi:hypothetical protein